MPDPVTGIVAGTAVLGASSSRSASKRAATSADRATAAQEQAAAAELAFAKEQYADWEAVYGPIQESLASYYSSLGPEYYEAQGIEAFQKEQEQAFTNLRESFVQRGIWDEGVGAAVELQTELAGAEERARIRAAAPIQAAEDKRAFLQIGLGQDPSGDIQQALAGQTQIAGQVVGMRTAQAQAAAQSAGQATQSAVTTAGTALADYFAKPAATTTELPPGVTS